MIDNATFRDRFEELARDEGLTLAEVADRCGWMAKGRNGSKRPDSSRVARTLGLAVENGKRRQQVSYENAVVLCRALHLDPCEAGV